MPSTIPGSRDDFSGDVSLTAPTGGVTAGLIYNIIDSFLAARETKSAGAAALFAMTGPVWVTKVTGTGKSFAVGEKIYWLTGTKKAQKTATGATLIGRCLRAAAASDTAVLIEFSTLPPTAT